MLRVMFALFALAALNPSDNSGGGGMDDDDDVQASKRSRRARRVRWSNLNGKQLWARAGESEGRKRGKRGSGGARIDAKKCLRPVVVGHLDAHLSRTI